MLSNRWQAKMTDSVFSSERLTFHAMDLSDLPLVESLFLEASAMLFYPADKIREQAKEWIQVMQRFYHDTNLGSWLLLRKTDGVFIGQCGLNKTPLCSEGVFELGFSILKQHWNKGYATEAAQRCIDLAKENDQINTLIAIVDVDNDASQRVLSKLPLIYKNIVNHGGKSVRFFQKDLKHNGL